MLRDDINNAVKDAMRAKDERKLSTLRMVNSTIKNADIDARGEGKPPLSDADLLGVLQKMIKQRQESVELYDKGGRAELAAQEREEIAIISAYLPKQMSEADVKAAISAAIAETGAAGMKDMGKVIGVAEGEIRRPDGFRQGQRHGEGGADGVSVISRAAGSSAYGVLIPSRFSASSIRCGGAILTSAVAGFQQALEAGEDRGPALRGRPRECRRRAAGRATRSGELARLRRPARSRRSPASARASRSAPAS